MRVYGNIIPGARRLASIPELSKRARQRLKWFDYYNSHGHNARLTCRYFGISPQTFYRWKRRYNPRHLESLEDRSHRPRQYYRLTHVGRETGDAARAEVDGLKRENERLKQLVAGLSLKVHLLKKTEVPGLEQDRGAG